MDQRPDRFVDAAQDLWTAMDAGTRFGYDRIFRFNGHFFADAERRVSCSSCAVMPLPTGQRWSRRSSARC